MKILLTGPKGNLGQALQQHGLKHQWIGIGRDDWPRLSALMRPAEVIIHAASDLVTPPHQAPRSVIESNLASTVWLLEELAKRPPQRFVFISSGAVYGRSQITREEIEPAPISINGITKFLNEELIREFCSHHRIDYQIFRLFNTYGGQDRFSIFSHLNRSLETKRPFTMNNQGLSQRDFVHVDDIAQVILALLGKPIRYPIMNIGSGETTRIRDIVTEFKKKNPDLEIVHSERPETEYSRADITKLREILADYEFRQVLDFIRQAPPTKRRRKTV